MRQFLFFILAFLAFTLLAPEVQAQTTADPSGITLSVDGGDGQMGLAIQIVVLMTLLSVAPALLVMTTSFTRILIVLGFLRQAIGTPQAPNNQVLVGLALFLSMVVMLPVGERVWEDAIEPYTAGEIEQGVALDLAIAPVRAFMLANTREKDLEMFLEVGGHETPEGPEVLPISVVVPAFLISELKTAFQMGFLLYIPFLVVDMVIASVLMSMGMMMLPPVLISLPFKILLFVLVDGWHLISRSLVSAYSGMGA